ncbi:uncharacterized protein LOC113019411 [Astatotilapia calliptera]|uniref:uncharacterized protein LOC113019411 n=1 Tax=Astatotilapia calliptera TaxID=8154 RepID=UPI000E40C295|nr:uncharacterized protein LOC113019411 [Astatotilapia calliptera]XP_026018915.1 uncharacterized protein LOC113019411 [Astatotilapia calliptera]
MFICYICKIHHTSCSVLFRHLKFQHGLYPGKFLRLTCGEPGCSFIFHTYSGYKRHLFRAHGDCVHSEVINNFEPVPNDGTSVSQPVNVAHPMTITTPVPVEKRQILNMCSSVIAQVQSSGVPESTVQLVGSLEELVNDIHAHAKQSVVDCLSTDTSRETLEKVEDCFDQLENPFSCLNTESKRIRYFEQKWKIVEPIEHVLGVRFDVRKDRTTGTYRQVPVNDKFMYVPIMGSLSSMFRNSELCSSFQKKKLNMEGLYRDLNDGSYFKNHSLFSQQEHALQIQLYYDDFETANPLGSKKGVHKLGCIYFVLRNLPPELNSVVMNIHLVALFHSEDLKKYGFDPILKPLVDDLKILETEGMQVPFSATPVRGSLFQITGDNLALHSIFGFVESFSANYCCRFCLTDKTELQSVFSEDHVGLTLRSKELHYKHCGAIQQNPALGSTFGVKRNCLLNSLRLFHISDNYAVDIMHDLLEGVVQYELKLVFQYLIKTSLISLNSLSQRIISFNYGYAQRRNRPGGLKLDDNSKDLGLNAVQSWCLLRNSPLIFGDIVCRNDGHWNLLLLLVQIVNIVFSPIITHGMTCYLKHLIADHHKAFKSLFPERNLIPKHHLMIHYPRCIRKIGPLIHMWCMRFEAKHKFFKRSVKNFKNITKTLVKKHQNQLAFHFENFYFKRLQFGPINEVLASSLKGSEALNKMFDVSSIVSTTSWVKSYGTEYQVAMYVCSGVENEMPLFSKIVSIIVSDFNTYLLTCKVSTVYFNDHLNAFVIEDGLDVFALISVDDLVYYRPYDRQFSNGTDDKMYIVPYCNFV